MKKIYLLSALSMSFSAFAFPEIYELKPGSSTMLCHHDINKLNADLLQDSFYSHVTVDNAYARIKVTKPYKVVSFTSIKDRNCALIEKK